MKNGKLIDETLAAKRVNATMLECFLSHTDPTRAPKKKKQKRIHDEIRI